MARPNEAEMMNAPDLMEWVSQDRRCRLQWSKSLDRIDVQCLVQDVWVDIGDAGHEGGYREVLEEAVGMLLEKAVKAAEGERLLDRIARGIESSQRMAEWQDRYKRYVERRDAYQRPGQVKAPAADVKPASSVYLRQVWVKNHRLTALDLEYSARLAPPPAHAGSPEGFTVSDCALGAWAASSPSVVEVDGTRSVLIVWQRLCRKEVQDGVAK